jgi:hypothetical protein
MVPPDPETGEPIRPPLVYRGKPPLVYSDAESSIQEMKVKDLERDEG